MKKTIKDLFIDELHDSLSSEMQIVKALPKVIEAASSPELKNALRTHLLETREQVKRLEKAFKLLKLHPKTKFCKGTQGIIEECNEAIREYVKSPLRDAAIISKAQRIEHYEISAYGTMCTFAKELGHKEIAKLLHTSLLEEENADKTMTKLAEGGFFSQGINHEANMQQTARKPATPRTATRRKTSLVVLSRPRGAKKATPRKAAAPKRRSSTRARALASARH